MEAPLSKSAGIVMNDGERIPVIGLGVYRVAPGESTEMAVFDALERGYRHIDTAAIYNNEADVGRAIQRAVEGGTPRSEIFVTTKIWNDDQGYESTITAAKRSLEKLQLDYIDLLILHSPLPGTKKRLDSYSALEKLAEDRIVKSIGVSNYGVKHLKELLDTNPNIIPAINQIELHPFLQHSDITDFCAKHKIVVEAYSPLTKGRKLRDRRLVDIADRYSKSTAQILIRWCIQRGFVTLPKSVKKARIAENAAVFDFELSPDDMRKLDGMDEYLTTGWDPTTAP